MITIRPYTGEHVSEVAAFNRRLGEKHREYQFPESPVPGWLPRRESIPLYQEFFVALEENAVRGGYILKPQAFALNGDVRMVSGVRMTVSEGVINSRYAMVGVQLLKDALVRQPQLFGLGMGGFHRPIARLLKSLKWRLIACPFFFRVVRPHNFLREIVPLRQNRSRRLAMDALAWSGLGWCGLAALRAVRGLRQPRQAGVTSQVVNDFGDWADSIWDRAVNNYSLIAVRNGIILNTLYPASKEKFIRLQVLKHGAPIGWAVLLDTQMTNHNYFGNMRVGTVVDCLANPGSEAEVIASATRHLVRRGVDLIVSNQLHRDWCSSFVRAGYLKGPSNFLFAASPSLTAGLDPFDTNIDRVHMTRGDGDGPIHL